MLCTREGLSSRAQFAEVTARELQYWDDWIRTKGFEYWARMANRELEEDIKTLIPRAFLLPQHTIRVLDAGSGPVTQLGSIWPGRDLELHACDALADQYNDMLKKYDIDPPVRTIAAQLEKLDNVYPREFFHFVLARNVIDQTTDPACSLRKMITVLKPGGRLLIVHDKSGPIRAAHSNGLWDVRDVRGHAILTNRARVINMTASAKPATVSLVNNGATMFIRVVNHAV